MHQKLMAVPWAKKLPVGEGAAPDGLKLVIMPTTNKHQPSNAILLRCNLQMDENAYFNGFSIGVAVFIWGV